MRHRDVPDLEPEMFGKAIRHLRKQRGMTLTELGAKVGDGGVSHVTVGRYERGERQPSPAMLQDIAEALGTNIGELRELNRALRGPESEAELEADSEAMSDYVTSKTDVTTWRDRVIRDPELNQWVQMILMALPIFLDRKSWVAPVTIDQFVRETGRTLELVEEHWPGVLDSPYVERLGENRWTLRLRFPE